MPVLGSNGADKTFMERLGEVRIGKHKRCRHCGTLVNGSAHHGIADAYGPGITGWCPADPDHPSNLTHRQACSLLVLAPPPEHRSRRARLPSTTLDALMRRGLIHGPQSNYRLTDKGIATVKFFWWCEGG